MKDELDDATIARLAGNQRYLVRQVNSDQYRAALNRVQGLASLAKDLGATDDEIKAAMSRGVADAVREKSPNRKARRIVRAKARRL